MSVARETGRARTAPRRPGAPVVSQAETQTPWFRAWASRDSWLQREPEPQGNPDPGPDAGRDEEESDQNCSEPLGTV